MECNQEVFVSYSGDQKQFAEELVETLKKFDIEVWFAPDSIQLGEKWAQKYANAASESCLMILVWSAGAAKSDHVDTEWLQAFSNKRTIIPVMRDDTPLPPQISFRQGIDLQDSLDKTTYNRNRLKLINQVNDYIGKLKDQSISVEDKSVVQQGDTFITIPEGIFYVGSSYDNLRYPNEADTQEFDLSYSYKIAVYPVLIGEFRKFIHEGRGYSTDAFWTEAGRQWRDANQVKQPLMWDQQNSPDFDYYPVEGISYFEAVAYASWYSSTKDDDFLYRLPTETEWEKAARGGIILPNEEKNRFPLRHWPWPGDWKQSLANTIESNLFRTISMHEHPDDSKSPYGVVGLSGNLLEWCLNKPSTYPSVEIESSEGYEQRVARGGWYYGTARDARCSRRIFYHPTERDFLTLRLVGVPKENGK